MYRGTAGIDAINQLMQDLLNPPQKDQLSFEAPQCHYRKGDKVIHLVNDAEINVFNGDLGAITDLIPGKYTESKQDEIVIDFDGNEVSYPRNEWYKIRLAYAMSIHKSQGSEFLLSSYRLPVLAGVCWRETSSTQPLHAPKASLSY